MTNRLRSVGEARRILGSYESALDAVSNAPPADTARKFGAGILVEGREAGPPGEGAPPGMAALDAAIADERQNRIIDGLEAMKKLDLGRDAEITPDEQRGLEAIVLVVGRPAILVQNDDFLEPPKKWAGLKDQRAQIQDVLKRVGRINVSGSANFEWLGTGFLVGTDVVMTNRHVAQEFSKTTGNQSWAFRAGMGSSVDLHAELGSEEPLEFTVTEIVGIHEDHDMAILRVEQTSGSEKLPTPLPIVKEEPQALVGRQVYVVGYPAWDGRRNDPEPMRRIFSEIYNVKRLQPGEISGTKFEEFQVFHDCSTLGGNSGSPVIDLESHKILGLHFGGRYMSQNFAIPLWTLQNDGLVKRAALNFD